jgi:hypothetical protein
MIILKPQLYGPNRGYDLTYIHHVTSVYLDGRIENIGSTPQFCAFFSMS